MPWVYLLRCGDGSLYAGSARDLPRRLAQHAAGRASRYTRAHLPVTLAWSRRVRPMRVSRPDKDALIDGAGRSGSPPGRAIGRPS